MNERLKELAFEAGLTITPCGLFEAEDTNLERFAELVRQDEREVCAALATQKAKHIFDQAEIYAVGASETANAQATAWQLKVLADEIRARGNHENATLS